MENTSQTDLQTSKEYTLETDQTDKDTIAEYTSAKGNPEDITGFTISGAGNTDVNGTYTKGADINGRVRFDGGNSGDSRISFVSSSWRIRYDDDTIYTSQQNTFYPWDVTDWPFEFSDFIGGAP